MKKVELHWWVNSVYCRRTGGCLQTQACSGACCCSSARQNAGAAEPLSPILYPKVIVLPSAGEQGKHPGYGTSPWAAQALAPILEVCHTDDAFSPCDKQHAFKNKGFFFYPIWLTHRTHRLYNSSWIFPAMTCTAPNCSKQRYILRAFKSTVIPIFRP